MPTRGLILSAARHVRDEPIVLVISLFVVSFLIQLWAALPQGLETQFYGVAATTSPQHLLAAIHQSDSATNLRTALTLHDGAQNENSLRALKQAPIGIVALFVAILNMTSGTSLMLPLILIQVVLGATVLTLAGVYLCKRRSYLTFIVFCFVWFLAPVVLSPGTRLPPLDGETIVTPVAAMAMMSLIALDRPPHASPPRYTAYTSLGVALAAIMSLSLVWQWAVPAALGVMAVIVVLRELVLRMRRSRQAGSKNRMIEWACLALAIVLVGIPSALYGQAILHPGSADWSQFGPGWVRTLAEELSHLAHDAIATVLSNPLAFVTNVVTTTEKLLTETSDNPLVVFLALLALLIALVVLLGQLFRRKPEQLMILLLFMTNIVTSWGFSTEASQIVQIIMLALAVVALSARDLEQRMRALIAPHLRRFLRRRA